MGGLVRRPDLIKAITAAYEQEETRGYFKLRGIALLTSIGVVVVAVIALGAIGIAPAIRHLVHNTLWRSRSTLASGSCLH